MAPETFKYDHILRDAQFRPVARCVLLDDLYARGDKIFAALVVMLVKDTSNIRAYTFYVDGMPYQMAEDTSDLKVQVIGSQHQVNNVVLLPKALP